MSLKHIFIIKCKKKIIVLLIPVENKNLTKNILVVRKAALESQKSFIHYKVCTLVCLTLSSYRPQFSCLPTQLDGNNVEAGKYYQR